MKVLLAALVLLSACATPPEPIPADTRPEPLVAQAVPDERPVAAIVVTSCNLLVVASVLMRDGTVYVFDSHSPVDAVDVMRFAETALRKPVRYEEGCYEGPTST